MLLLLCAFRTEKAMKVNLAYNLVFVQLFEATAELIFRRLTENQSLELSCSPPQEHNSLTGLHLYHRDVLSQTTLLSLGKGGKLRLNPEHMERLQLFGGLDSMQVNITISSLQPNDTGLYIWELSYRENSSDHIITTAQKVFLFVEGRPCQCFPRYRPLLFTIFTVAGLLLLTLSWLAIGKCVKARHHLRPQASAPIYEEMTRKQQRAAITQNNQEAPSHLEEVDFPVYANPNIRLPQDNYYACPRQLALRA